MSSGAARAAFGLGVLQGAFLLFLVQPLIAKQILPWFGGGPAVWSACLMFFQTALVAGYGYAHVTRRLSLRRQAWLHVSLMALAALTLPIGPSVAWKPLDGSALVTRVIVLLTVTVGPSFVLVAATAPLLQDWFARANPGRSPYYLYIISNLGSLAALLTYPLLLEPYLEMPTQSLVWSAGFVAFVILCAWCARLAVRAAEAAPGARAAIEGTAALAPVSAADLAWWIVLPAIGSGLLLATTSQLSQDIAAVPLIWVVPLALYLLSYIVGFAGWYHRAVVGTVLIGAVAFTLFVLRPDTKWGLASQGASLLLAFFAGCLVCHAEFARRRPDVGHLTMFYLAMSVGGSLGGLFVAVVAPLIFNDYLELPLLLIAAVAVALAAAARDYQGRHQGDVRTLASASITAAFAVAVIGLLSGATMADEVARRRGFYGVVRIVEDPMTVATPTRRLYHGRILHGLQFRQPALRRQAASYYSEGTGIALAISRHPRRLSGQPLTIGAIGLGTGTIAALGVRGDRVRFFEIDSMIVDVARTYFTFLADSEADVDIAMGDARLTLERDNATGPGRHRYDVLAIDAFSGDAIPVHLLTREGFEVYTQALKPDGVLAIHISNRYLDLRPVVYGLADHSGWEVIRAIRRPEPSTRTTSSDWLIVTRNETMLTEFSDAARKSVDDPGVVIWTDSFSSLLSVIRR